MDHGPPAETSHLGLVQHSFQLGLLTLGAIFLLSPTPYADPDLSSAEEEGSSRHYHHHPHPQPLYLSTQSRIKWGTELSHKIRKFTIEFVPKLIPSTFIPLISNH